MHCKKSKQGFISKKSILKTLCVVFLLCTFATSARAQAPPNDDCADATDIVPGGIGWNTGIFHSPKTNLKYASRQNGESFTDLQIYGGTDKKSVWYKFSIDLHRSVTVHLIQKDSLISQNAVSFAIYRASNCLPDLGEISKELPVISKFGFAKNYCLTPGDYLVQVCAKDEAKDSVWIDLDVQHANAPPFDDAANAYDLGVIKTDPTHATVSASIPIGCYVNANAADICPALGPKAADYNQTTWIVFKTPAYADAFSFNFNVSGVVSLSTDSLKFAYNYYEGNVKTGPINLIGGCNIYPKVPGKTYACNVKPNTWYTLHTFSSKYDKYSLNLNLTAPGKDTAASANPQHIDKGNKLGLLASKKIYTVKDNFSCNSRMVLYPCGSAMKIDSTSYYDATLRKYVYYKDTFKISSWFTFSLGSPGLVSITGVSGSSQVKLYKGDITKDCNLNQTVPFSGAMCMEPGDYSCQVFGNSSSFGGSYQYDISLKTWAKQPPSHYYLPALAENLGDITPALDNSGITALSDYFDTIPRKDSIDGIVYLSNSLYRQFYISKPCFLNIKDHNNVNSNIENYLYLFSGKATDGLNALKFIKPDQYGIGLYTSISSFQSGCIPLPAGWYTVRTAYFQESCKFTIVIDDYITIDTFIHCTLKFNRPYKACLVNNLNPIGWGPDHGAPGLPDYSISYSLPGQCMSCTTDTPFGNFVKTCPLSKSANVQSAYNRIVYYVFNIGSESFMRINDGIKQNYNYIMCRGNIKLDSTIAMDTKNILQPCDDSRNFCRLQPGTYTLIVFANNSDPVSPTLFFDRVLYSKYDNASKAYDFGLVPVSGAEIVADPDIISCTTGAYGSDPYLNQGNKISVPVPAPSNFHQPIPYPARNLWYTFTGTGVGKYTLKLYNNDSNYTNGLEILVFKTRKNANTPFSMVQSNYQVDSTILQGLQPVALGHKASYFTDLPDLYTFTKTDCDTYRYYMLINNRMNPSPGIEPYMNMKIKASISFAGIVYSLKGDFCNDAYPMSLNGAGSAFGSTSVYCHTTGESYGEDGSNMACLTDGTPYKTTWFKISDTSSQKIDLTFSLSNGTDAPNSKVRYRVLYGSCEAMTPGPCVQDGGASFRLDCMGKGDYFVQVVEPASAGGNVGVSVTATPASIPVCNPVKPFQPLANFVADGGCNTPLVRFINYSTQGSAVKYYWDFGNGMTSTLRQPSMNYTAKKSIDTFYVSLKVMDTLHGTGDSVRIPVYVFRDPVTLTVNHDTTITCGQKVQLHANVGNFAYAIFTWDNASVLDDPYIADPLASPTGNTTFVVTAKVQNCILVDSVHIKINKNSIIKGDTVLCEGQTGVLTAPPGSSFYEWYYKKGNIYIYDRNQSITIDSPRIYYLYLGGCPSVNSIEVKGISAFNHSIGNDTTLCKGQTLKLLASLPGNTYKWSTGDTTMGTIADKSGLYKLETGIGKCYIHDSVKLSFIDFNTNFAGAPDTTICRGFPAWIDAGVSYARYLWSTGETTRNILVRKAGTYTVTVSLPGCSGSASKTVYLQAPPQTNIGAKDTSFCEGESGTINVNPVPGARYRWSTGDTLTSIKVFKTGDYSVDVHKDVCDTLLTKHVEVVPLPNPDLGHDTVSCFNFEKTLDAGPGYEYLWYPGGRTSRYLDIYIGGTYAVTVKNILGCPGYDTVNIVTHCEEATLFVPNIFTPGIDGINDSFKAEGTHITQFRMRIYNRWGEEVFHSDNIEQGWDGKIKNLAAPMDVYLWIIDYSAYAKAQTMKGTVHLVR